MAQKLIFLETSDIGARHSAQAARHLGFEPIFLVQIGNYQADTLAQLRAERTIECNTNNVDTMVEALKAHNIQDIVGIMTFLDSKLSLSLELASSLDVRGLDPAILRLKDKGGVASLIPEFSPRTLSFHRDMIPVAQIELMLAKYERLILKPTQTAGGIGNFTITTVNFEHITKIVKETNLPSALDQGHWVIQSFCEGPLISAEGFVQDGKMKILGFSDRQKIGLTESQINFPVDDSLTEQHRQQCLTALAELVERSGFRHGYFHVEFILSPNGALIIDANMGRLGGGSIGEQIATSYNLDPIDVFAHVITNSLFPVKASSDPYSKPCIATRGILYGLPARGRFEALALPELLGSRHTQILDAGQNVPEMGVNNWSWISILSGPTSDVETVIRNIKVRSNGKWQTPCY